MRTQDILDEVERRIAERLPAVLFERALIAHAKHSFRHECPCSYCQIKREATTAIGNAVRGFNYHLSSIRNLDDFGKFKKAHREIIRAKYRAKMGRVYLFASKE